MAAPEAADITLNLVGAEIETVIKTIGQLTGTTFVIDPRAKGVMTLVSEKPLTKSQVFALLASHLRLQGMTIVQGDGFSRVVPEGEAKLQSSPTITNPGSGIKGDQIATQIYRLNYESSMNLVTILRPLISPNNTINANPGNNTLVITDYADNLTRLGKIIAALDAPSAADFDVIPVRHAVASDIAVMVNRLMEPSTGGADSGRVSVLADSRTNNLILRAPSVARANLTKSLIAKLDQPTKQAGNVHVVYLKNADATKLAQTLRAVLTADASASSSSSASQPGGIAQPGSPTAPNPPSSPSIGAGMSNPSASFGSSSSANAGNGQGGFIQADAATNTLIITANEATYRNIRNVIEQLDVRRVQVYIESMIVEVTSGKEAEFGIQWLGASGNDASKYRVAGAQSSGLAGANNNLLALAGGKGKVLPGAGFSLGLFKQTAGQIGLGALAHAVENDNGVNILSTPNLITLDNEEAKIIVGQNVPFITGQYANSGGSTGNNSTVSPFTTVDRKDVGLQLRVKPQVSEGGTVKLQIYQESSSIDDATNAAGIITKKRSIETSVLADDGQIVVLGGLMEDNTADKMEKVPGLGDIPFFGNFFKYQKRGRTKTNLLVFLRPVVIKTEEQNTSLSTDRYNYIRTLQGTVGQPNPKATLPSFGAGQLPELEKGVPVGGNLVKPVPPAPKRVSASDSTSTEK
jgi:general secretion pathway protein D